MLPAHSVYPSSSSRYLADGLTQEFHHREKRFEGDANLYRKQHESLNGFQETERMLRVFSRMFPFIPVAIIQGVMSFCNNDFVSSSEMLLQADENTSNQEMHFQYVQHQQHYHHWLNMTRQMNFKEVFQQREVESDSYYPSCQLENHRSQIKVCGEYSNERLHHHEQSNNGYSLRNEFPNAPNTAQQHANRDFPLVISELRNCYSKPKISLSHEYASQTLTSGNRYLQNISSLSPITAPM